MGVKSPDDDVSPGQDQEVDPLQNPFGQHFRCRCGNHVLQTFVCERMKDKSDS
jgi:hypothetical protein